MATPPDSSAHARPVRARQADQPTGSGAADGAEWKRRARLLLLAAAVFFVLWLARGIIGPFVVAAVLAYAFTPIVSAVQSRTRLPRALIIGIGYLLFLGGAIVVGVLAAERVGSELRELSSGGQDIIGSALHKLFGDTLTIAFPPGAEFHRRQAEEPKGAGLLKDALYEVTGHRLELVFAEGEASSPQDEPDHPVTEEEIVELVKSTFDARELDG